MRIDDETCFRALAARDARFDGLFFVGVTTTRIYCRPICPARTAGRDRCRFFADAALAEREGFRPCLRCRPELAPGHAPVDSVRRTARVAAARIEAGALNDGGSLAKLARDLGLGERQLRRAIRQEYGVSPIELAQTRRLLLAKQLLTESDLPIVRVAFASGFESVRRFNALFQSHYRLTPTTMRRSSPKVQARDSLRLTLAYRPPLAWDALLRFLSGRSTSGVEQVEGGAYLRTAAVGPHRGWLKVEPDKGRNTLAVELAMSLDARSAGGPRPAEEPLRHGRTAGCHLGPPGVRPTARRTRSAGTRACGCRARSTASRWPCAPSWGSGSRSRRRRRLPAGSPADSASRLKSPFPGLARLSPTPDRLADAEESELTALGIGAKRAVAIRSIAQAVAQPRARAPARPRSGSRRRRTPQFPGIGDWTAQVIAMRRPAMARRLPRRRPGIAQGGRDGLGESAPRRGRGLAPWRAYAAMYLWSSVSSQWSVVSWSVKRRLSMNASPHSTVTIPARSASCC